MALRKSAWKAIGILAIIVIPALVDLFLVRQGFKVRDSTPFSDRYIQDAQAIPSYYFISQRGDTITSERMHNKVCILNFYSYACEQAIDHEERRLFTLQEDYYQKTVSFRILTITRTPQDDSTHMLNLSAQRYAAREIWHFLRNDSDSSTGAGPLYRTCCSILTQSDSADINHLCFPFVFLVDRTGKLRGYYDPTQEDQYNALYQDVQYCLNQKI